MYNPALLLRCAAVALCSVGSLPCYAAEPARDTFALNWVRVAGAEECVSSQSLAHLLEQIVGPVLQRPFEADYVIEGAVQRAEKTPEWHVRIRVMDASGVLLGEREIRERRASCSAVTESVLLVMAVIIDPDAAVRGLPSHIVEQLSLARRTEDTTPSEPAAAQPRPVAEPTTMTPESWRGRAPTQADRWTPPPANELGTPGPPRRPMAMVGAAEYGTGLLPASGFGFGVGVHVDLSTWGMLSADASYWLPSEVPLDSPRVTESEVDFFAASSRWLLCRSVLRPRPIELFGCVGGLVGLRWVYADALQQANSAPHVFAGPALSSQVQVELTQHLFAFLGVGAVWLLPRDRFSYRTYSGQERSLFEAPATSGWISLGLGVRP